MHSQKLLAQSPAVMQGSPSAALQSATALPSPSHTQLAAPQPTLPLHTAVSGSESVSASGIGAQMPFLIWVAACRHEPHGSSQRASQHTPSAQMLLKHSASFWHASPSWEYAPL